MTYARVDDNQKQIVKHLRDHGVSVAITSAAKKGFPDLVCGYQGKNVMLEIKDGSKPESAQRLTQDQQVFHAAWQGQIAVVNSPETAINEIMRVCSL
jgi:Holliday junction resolvase